METLDLIEILNAVEGICDFPDINNVKIKRVSTDSRNIQSGDLFIALTGDNFDGHNFAADTVSRGASAIIASKSLSSVTGVPVIEVSDTLEALWKLAGYYRQKFRIPVIAVTGSVGKTTTKDIIAATLSGRFNVHKSRGNFNNHIGMPLTILELEKKHSAMVVEMGMRGPGEIRQLTNIAKPDIAVITNIGISHIERLGSRENILKAKLEITEGLNKKGVLVINNDDTLLKNIDKSVSGRIVTVGTDEHSDIIAGNITDNGLAGVSFDVKMQGRDCRIDIPSVGVHNVYNVLSGIACGLELGMTPDEIMSGIKSYQPEKMRLNIIEKDGIKFINDCYNASPDSMKAGLQVLGSISCGSRTIAILGSMFELGDMAKEAHFNVGKMCRDSGVFFTAIIGENAEDVAAGINDREKCGIFQNHEDIVKYMKEVLRENDVVLIKGSRGMKMERILELWG